MAHQHTDLEERIARLENQVAELTAALVVRPGDPSPQVQPGTPVAVPPAVAAVDEVSDELLFWVDRAYLLPRMATTCFILVVAMTLRTLTDGGILPLELGTLLGMVYAAGLIGWGGLSYERKSPQAPVFALWGTFVFCSVVVETHRVFQSLPVMVAYLLLASVGMVSALMSRRYRAALPVFAGTLGMSFGAFAVEYPSPFFAVLTLILMLANGLAAFATRLLRASWLRWLLLVLTIFLFMLWEVKLRLYLRTFTDGTLDVAMTGFAPSAAVVALILTGISWLGVTGRIQEKVSRFDIALPVVSALLLSFVTAAAVRYTLVPAPLLAMVLILWGGAHGGLAWHLIRKGGGTVVGATAFTLAGSILVATALPWLTGNPFSASTLLALSAGGLALGSHKLQSSGVRAVSYLVQVAAGATLVALLQGGEELAPSLSGAVASGLLTLCGGWHYWWARRTPLPPGGEWSVRLNRNDRWAAALLATALLSGFFTLRTGLYQGVMQLHLPVEQAMGGGESLLVSCSALILLWLARRRQSRELRNVGVLITAVAAVRVGLDLLQLKGVYLLVSLFSFGLLAALASLVLGGWKRHTASPP